MTLVKNMGKTLELNYIFERHDIKVAALVGAFEYDNSFIYLKGEGNKMHMRIRDDSPISEIVGIAFRMCEDKYKQITKVCIDLIGKQVYLDEDMMFYVEAITAAGITCTRYGETYTLSQEKLWIRR